MLITAGFFDPDGNPSVAISLSGLRNSQPVNFTAIVDTGFSGFVSMPLVEAFPLGLPLVGTTGVILADGSNQTKLVAEAVAKVGERIRTGLVILEEASTDILVGMDFLRAFEAALLMTRTELALLDESQFQKMMTEAKRNPGES
jgi:predicted aspartyl protease